MNCTEVLVVEHVESLSNQFEVQSAQTYTARDPRVERKLRGQPEGVPGESRRVNNDGNNANDRPAELHALEGNASRALDCLARAADAGMPCLTCFENDPFLVNLRATGEYQAFAQNLRARQMAFLRASSEVTGR